MPFPMQTPSPPRATRGLPGTLRAILMLALGAAILAPMLTYPFGADHGCFATVADVIARGGVPYRDAWDIKPPGVYYLFWATFSAFGRSILSIRLLDLLWTLAAAAALYLIARRLFSRQGGWASAFFFLVFYALGFDFWHTAQADGFGSLPLALAFLLALVAEDKAARVPQAGKLLALCSGLLIGIAITLKFTLGAFLVVPLVLALSARQPLAARLGRGASYLLGCLLAPALVALLMWKAGALRDMIYIVFTWNSQYGHIQAAGSELVVIPSRIARFHLGGGLLILKLIGLLCLVGLADAIIRRRSLPRWWLLPLWWAVMVASVCVQGKYFAYHWLPVLPPLALLAGLGWAAAVRWAGQLAGGRRPAVIAGLLLILLGLFAQGYWAQFHRPIAYATRRLPDEQYLSDFTASGHYFSFPADLALAQYLRDNSPPKAPIFSWGLDALVYFLADRPPASRFIQDQPLLTPWSPPQWREELIQDLSRNRPQFILVAHDDIQPWVTLWNGDSASALPYYPELARLIVERYRPAAVVEDFEVWERK